MRVLVWHVHGSWLTSFLQGSHDYLLPTLPGRGPDGLGRADSWDWPASAVEVSPAELADAAVDVVVLQRPHELELATRWLGRRPGRDLAAVYLEHNTPGGDVPFTRHPLAGQSEIPVVHVTAFNALMWDAGRTPTRVVEHGVKPLAEARWHGELERGLVVVNHLRRRGRRLGLDVFQAVDRELPLALAGMDSESVGARLCLGEVPHARLPQTMAAHRFLFNPIRYTSLGLAVIEAMMVGLPVVGLATTELVSVIRNGENGWIDTRPERLLDAMRRLLADRGLAAAWGAAARRDACERFGIGRFVDDWCALLREVAG